MVVRFQFIVLLWQRCFVWSKNGRTYQAIVTAPPRVERCPKFILFKFKKHIYSTSNHFQKNQCRYIYIYLRWFFWKWFEVLRIFFLQERRTPLRVRSCLFTRINPTLKVNFYNFLQIFSFFSSKGELRCSR